MFTHTRMPLQISCSTRHIFVFRKVRHTTCSKWDYLFLTIGSQKYTIPFLLLPMRFTNSFQSQVFHYLHVRFLIQGLRSKQSDRVEQYLNAQRLYLLDVSSLLTKANPYPQLLLFHFEELHPLKVV